MIQSIHNFIYPMQLIVTIGVAGTVRIVVIWIGVVLQPVLPVIGKCFGAAGFHSMTAELIEWSRLVGKRLVSPVWEIYACYPIVIWVTRDRGQIAGLILSGMQKVIVCVCVIDCRSSVPLSLGIARRQRKSDLGYISGDRITGVVGNMVVAIGNGVDPVIAVVALRGSMVHKVLCPSKVPSAVISEFACLINVVGALFDSNIVIHRIPGSHG